MLLCHCSGKHFEYIDFFNLCFVQQFISHFGAEPTLPEYLPVLWDFRIHVYMYS